MDEIQHGSPESALVPSEVLDEARSVIAQLMEEVGCLRLELEEQRLTNAKYDDKAANCNQSRLSHSTQSLDDHEDERTVVVLKKSLLQKSKTISTLRKQLQEGNQSKDDAITKLAVATQELDKMRKRESTLAREAESSRKEAEQCRLQTQAVRQAYEELTVYVTGVLQRLRHYDDDTRKRTVSHLDALWEE